ncbi:hypothetical protein [Halorhabdus salina]|uniref:hypothetical protein n=1 Tax=Halorhabdus salina TaxID=2750670 RepID=UPI002867BF71|nr:hypothetical protein [Halorhabdus salina]
MAFDTLDFHERAVLTPSHEDVTAMRRLLVETLADAGVEPTVDEAGGTMRESLERFVRFIKIVRFHGPGITVFNGLALLAITTVFVLFLVLTTVAVTLAYGLVYAAFGIHRWTFLLAVPATVADLPLFAYALARRTFHWGGRRYRWRSMFDVEIVE